MVKRVVIQRKLPKLESDTNQEAPSWPGLSRPSTSSLQLAAKKGVDARVKPGHDGERAELRRRTTRKPVSLLGLAGILNRLEGREFDVVEFAVDLLDLADVDVLDDVAGFRIDRDRAARAFPLHALHRPDQRIAIGLAAGLLQRLVDQADAVIATDRHEARARAKGLLIGGDEFLICRRGMRPGIEMRGDRA